ncbi:MAG: TetR/AcrR family transcriptional regulator [Polyangiaceae bacterium]
MSRAPSDLRQRALAAALLIATRDGAGALSLDAVAKEAEISKGGLTHHFPSKDALVLALVEKLVFEFEGMVLARAAADKEPVGRFTRAFVEAMESPEIAGLGRALIAVVALKSSLVEPLRQSQQRCQKHMENDGIDPVTIVHCGLYADAVWFRAIFDFPPLPKAAVAAVRKSLMEATRVHAKP